MSGDWPRKRGAHRAPRLCSWCHNPLSRGGECADCDSHRLDHERARREAWERNEESRLQHEYEVREQEAMEAFFQQWEADDGVLD